MYVVAGVSGNTGSVVADTLLAQGKPVRVLVRDAKKGEPWKARGAEVAVATLDDEQALVKAFAGAKGAYLLLPPDPTLDDFRATRKKTIEAIARAIEASKLPHVVLLSSVGAQHAEGTGVIGVPHDAEKRFAKTGAKLTAVRASYFLENWAAVAQAVKTGKLPTFLAPDQVIPQVGTKDIGRVAAKALAEGPRGDVDIIELAGARDLSARDVAALFGQILGRPIDIDAAPVAAVKPAFQSFGLTASVAEGYQGLYEGIASGKVAAEPGNRVVRGTEDPAAVLRALVA